MAGSQSVAGAGLLVLGVDTCGPSGSVALARVFRGGLEVLGQTELAGRTYSAVLVGRVAEILEEAGLKLADVDAIVVVNGPGSFTGVRVGLSAVKGLAEPGQIPVVAVSRLEVMAAKAGVGSAALDAHRHEVFLRVESDDGVRELLAGAEELAGLRQSQVSEARPSDKLRAGSGAPDVLAGPVAVCDEATESLLKEAWPEASLARTLAPRAADAIEMCVSRILAGRFADLALLDGHYLRRSDAEIFGGSASKAGCGVGKQIRVRRMRPEDLDGVMGIAAATPHAPAWHREAYGKALDLEAQPRRVALVAEDQSGALVGFAVASLTPPEAELESIATAAPNQRRGVARELFSVLKAELRRQGTAEVMLEVREANHSALEFYRFLGFREEGRRKSYYADPVEDAVLMRLRLR